MTIHSDDERLYAAASEVPMYSGLAAGIHSLRLGKPDSLCPDAGRGLGRMALWDIVVAGVDAVVLVEHIGVGMFDGWDLVGCCTSPWGWAGRWCCCRRGGGL
jgi:hypothetical protein